MILSYPTYSAFVEYLRNDYKPYRGEVYSGVDIETFKHPFYALTHSLRFYKALEYFDSYFPDRGGCVLDIGGYPGTMLKLIRKYCPRKLVLYQCGLYNDSAFQEEMVANDIEMLPLTDIDPPVQYKEELEGNHRFVFSLKPESVDYVIATEVIEHLVYPLHLLDEVKRVLRPGGRIFITTPNIAKSSAWVRTLLGKSNLDPLRQTQIYMNDNWRGHVRLYSREELFELLTDRGFVILEATAVNHGDYLGQRIGLIRRVEFFIRFVIESVLPWTKPGLLVVAEKR